MILKKIELIQHIASEGVVAVLRAPSLDEVIRMAEEAIRGGIRIIEVTMTVPHALRAIEQLAMKYAQHSNGVVIGAGTVLDPETARAAMLSGAAFIVGPALHQPTIELCNRYRVPIMPGVMTIREIQTALELGVDIVKLFPGQLFSPAMIRAIHGPLPQANIMPTGGVSLANIGEWVQAGAIAVGIGSDLTAEAVRSGNYALIAEKAAEYVEALRAARG